MPENILQNIIKKKEIRIAELKKKKPLERIVADNLVKQHERNEKLREKEIGNKFLDLF